MGRQKEKPQVLFKNSNNTFNTYSKTCSAFSESITKSIIMQLKKKIQNKNYYVDNGTVKRDLSIETDICILRSYIKENKRRIQNKHSSARFKYSINNTNKETIDESKADTSACGDSQRKFENAQLKVDLTTLVVDNLKTLLNDWIKKYLLENNQTKQKIATVLDSILHKFELEQTSSSGTYTLDVEVINEALTTDSTTSRNDYGISLKRNSDPKISAMTVPLTGKRVKLISTLSIPKILSKYTKNKTKRTHIQFNKTSINKLLPNSSSCNVLEIRTESFTKRCATYQKPKWEKSVINNKFNYNPQSTHATITSIESNDISVEHIDTVEDSTKKEFKSDCKIIVDDRLENRNNIDILAATQNKPVIVTQYKKHCNKKFKRKTKLTKQHRITFPTFQNIKAKSFSYHCKKPSKKFTKQKKFLNYIENILQYFEKYNYDKNIKLDIQINVSSDIIENENDSDIENCRDINDNVNKTTLLYNESKNVKSIRESFNNHLTNHSNDGLKIISLLDAAISQTKYIISRQISTNKSNKKIEIGKSIRDQQTGTSGLEIVQDLVDIKNIIKDLVSVAENFVKYHIDKKKILSSVKYIPKASKKSIAVQCVNTETKNVLTSGIKLKKEPKQNVYNPRLIKRSTSYQIIESESVLEVHDLTLPKNIIESVADKELPASTLPKSQSVVEITPTEHNRKILAFYCDKCIKARQCIYSACNHNVPCADMYPTCCNNNCQNIRHKNIDNIYNADCPEDRRPLMQCNFDNCRIVSRQNCNDADEEATSVYLDIDRTTCNKKVVITKRSVGFKEGCFYCTILWIPVLVIMWFFYIFILKAFIETKRNTLKSPVSLFANNNSSGYPISLTDLGF